MRVLACYSMKGGVGKTATSVNLAYWAAQTGLRTLLIDLDPQGASSFYYRVRPAKKELGKRFFKAYEEFVGQIKATDFHNLDIIPAHLSFRNFDTLLSLVKKRKNRLRKVLKGLKKHYTLVILDCPPSISHLSEAVFTAADKVVVPVIPTTLSERTFEQLEAFFKRYDYQWQHVVPFFTMTESQKTLHKKTMATMRALHPQFLKTVIPYSVDIESMGEHRSPVDLYAHNRPANKAYYNLWQELFGLLRKNRK